MEMNVQEGQTAVLSPACASCAESLECTEVDEKTYWPNESFSKAWNEALSGN